MQPRVNSRRAGYRRPGVLGVAALFVGVLLALLLAGVAVAQADQPDAATPGDVTADEVNAVARQLWCPLCSGVRLDACELKACEQMKEVIAIKLAEGEDVDSIKQYFVAQYGPQVLGEPPREGFNWLAWILPVVALVVGGAFFWRRTQSMVRPAPDPVTPDATQRPVPEDDYERKLEEELAKYG